MSKFHFVTAAIFILFISSYFFLIPEEIKVNYNKKGYWGAIDAEFDWCEYNYRWSFYVAEPLNVLTSSLYSLWGIVMYYYYYASPSPFSHASIYDLQFGLLLSVGIGIGSMLFHGSLKYQMQLLDELPMSYAATFTVFLYYFRKSLYPCTTVHDSTQTKNKKNKNNNNGKNKNKNNNNNNKNSKTSKNSKNSNNGKNTNNNSDENRTETRTAYPPLTRLALAGLIIWNMIVTVVLYVTEKDVDFYHTVGRGAWTFSFAGSLLYLYFAAQSASEEVNLAIYGKRAFLWYFAGAFFWFSDNFFCNLLQNMPLNIPYLQFHALGWHTTSTFAINYWWFCLFLHRLIYVDKLKLNKDFEIKQALFGTIDYVVMKEKHL